MDNTSHMNGGIYVHIPFCVKKCPYCDFYSITDLSLSSRYLRALTAEIQHFHSDYLNFDTIYIGGGTPSVLSPDDISRILEAIFQRFHILKNPEITIEVNPGTVSLEQFKRYRQAGVNRLNIGIQSFQEKNLAFLERIHSAKEAKLAFERARRAGFDNIGMDLIYGLPEQSKENWLYDLEQAVQMRPDHLSCYMLTCESGTPLHRNLQSGRYHPLNDRMVRALFDLTMDYLKAHGYLHYEISNYARKTGKDSPSRMSRHNLKYWTFAPYLGLGAGAHSFIEPQRSWNYSNVERYIRNLESGQPPVEEAEVLSSEQLITEAVYLGFRTIRGIDLGEFKQKFGLDFLQVFKETINELENEGLLQKQPDHIALSRKGLAFLDSVVSMFTAQHIKVPDYGGVGP
jgi:oxygen-independent coproporphyrinogen-3 oxidase